MTKEMYKDGHTLISREEPRKGIWVGELIEWFQRELRAENMEFKQIFIVDYIKDISVSYRDVKGICT